MCLGRVRRVARSMSKLVLFEIVPRGPTVKRRPAEVGQAQGLIGRSPGMPVLQPQLAHQGSPTKPSKDGRLTHAEHGRGPRYRVSLSKAER